MNISSSDRVNDYFSDIQLISPDKFESLITIRKLFFNANRNLVEEIKYGGLVFNLSDALIGGIFTYKKHLSIEFSNGAEFTDIDSVLEGGGGKRRHIKIFTSDDIIQKNCEYYINQACRDE